MIQAPNAMHIWVCLCIIRQSAELCLNSPHTFLGVSRFVSAFETPVKVTLQVYRSLLRSYNTADQDLVQASLQILVPQLERRLSSDELEVALKYTSKIIQEEGNSVQQLAHLLQCITRHPEVYRRCSSVLIPQMIHTLSIVGVSPNSLNSELKQLLISVAKLVFDWSTPPAQQTVVVALVNFLVKVILLNAEEKAELTHHRIHSQAMTLLSRILSFHPKVHLSKVHFERVLALGTANDDALTISSDASKKTIEKNKTMTEENCNTVLVYIASLEVLSIFLTSKSLDALKSIDTRGVIVRCFSHDSSVKDRKVQELLKEFVANSIGSSVLDHATLVPLLEEAIIAASSSATGREDEVKIQRSCLAIDIIVNICATNPVFVEPLIGSLLGFVKAFETTSPAHESQNETRGLKSPATPTLGVFHYACGIGVMSDSMTIDYNLGYKHGETHVLPKESLSAPQKAQIQIIRLLSTSSVLSTFSDTRRRFIEALLLLLDSSSCIPLLITVLSIVSDLVLKKKKQNCVIRSEKEELLLRMAHFDFNKLPITASQIIADMVCIITLCLCGFDPSSHTFTAIEHNHHGMESVRNKLFPLCLLSGNCTLRSMALRVFAKKKLTSEPSTNFFGIPHTSPHDVIYQYFNADLECIGNRMHTVLLTDLLLAVSKYKGGISQEGYLRPRRKSSSENIHKIKPQELSEEHSVFVEHLLLDQNETQCGNGSCILTAIRDLIHLDISTNQSILESCAQAAWDQLPSHHERIALIESLEKLLSMPYHFQFLDIKRGVGPWNVIQSILRLAFHLRPMPWIDSKLLLTLSTKYSMHYEVLAYLEQQYQALTRNDLKESSDSTMVLQNIHELFSYLNDRDVSLGISSAICSLPGTKFALSLDKVMPIPRDLNDSFMHISLILHLSCFSTANTTSQLMRIYHY
jgi:transformation/transcription domain-associated protein